MPRITIPITDEQLSRLTRLNDALNQRAQRVNPDEHGTTLEGVASTAFEYGMQELRRIWYAGELTELSHDPRP